MDMLNTRQRISPRNADAPPCVIDMFPERSKTFVIVEAAQFFGEWFPVAQSLTARNVEQLAFLAFSEVAIADEYGAMTDFTVQELLASYKEIL